ncbi:AzlD domain-containing protein [Pseudomonas sp. R2.Fl]|nr:AzlD domain-containing protein [Pseudomonas sp. R2.Fl]
MTVDLPTLAAILAMAAATVMTRLGGLLILRFVTLSPRSKRLLDAIPPAVLAAVVAPTAFATGIAEAIGCLLTALTATRLSMLPAAAMGVVTVALLRAFGL